MDDMISRQAAIDALDEIEAEVADGYGYQYAKWREYFVEMPSAQPERKTGRWIDETLKPWGLVHHPYKCSQCGEHSEMDSDFCPNCGAKMDEEEESNHE